MSAQTTAAVPLQNLRQHLAASRSLARLLTYHQRRELARAAMTPAELAADFERRHRVAAAKTAASTAASPRFMYRKTPLGLADARRVARAVGVRKLTPTETGVLGFLRRAVSCGKSGMWLSQAELAQRLNCHPESVRRAERRLERLELVVRVPQYLEQPWLNQGKRSARRRSWRGCVRTTERLERSMQLPSVLVLGPVGRQCCAPSRVRKPASSRPDRPTRRAAPSRRRVALVGGYNSYPLKELPSGSLPEGRESRGDSGAAAPELGHTGAPAAGPEREEVSPAATGSGRLTAASVERGSNAGGHRRQLDAPARSGAFGEGEGAPPAPPRDVTAWLSACPAVAEAAFSGETRDDDAPESPAPGAAGDVTPRGVA